MTDPTNLIARADAAMDGVTEGPWAAGTAQWPEQVGCCPLIGRPYSIHGTDFHNVSAATTQANARFIAASRQLVPALRDALAAALTRAELAECHAEAMEAERDRLREIIRAVVAVLDYAKEKSEAGSPYGSYTLASIVLGEIGSEAVIARAALTGEPQR